MRIFFILITLLLIPLSNCFGQSSKETPSKEYFAVQKTEKEWKKQLSPIQYNVLRRKGTERAFTGIYYNSFEEGSYVCAGCNTLLYKSDNKFDGHCGWPSFDRGTKNIGYRPDRSLNMVRIEIYCKQCGGHLGHVFNDGPRLTTGKRHCVNSASIKFIPKQNL